MAMRIYQKPARRAPREPEPAAMVVNASRTSMTLNTLAARTLVEKAVGDEPAPDELYVLLLWDDERNVAGMQLTHKGDSRAHTVSLRPGGGSVRGARHFVETAQLPTGKTRVEPHKPKEPKGAAWCLLGFYEPHVEPGPEATGADAA